MSTEHKGWSLPPAADEKTKPVDPTPVKQQTSSETEQDDTIKLLQEKAQHTCPRCQWDIRNPTPKLVEPEQKEYLRCILANKPYEKDISLFNGNFVVSFREQTDTITEEVMRLIYTVKERNYVESMTISRKIQALYSVTAIKVDQDKKTYNLPAIKEFPTWEEATSEFAKRFGGVTETRQVLVFKALITFHSIIAAASEGAFDENFYQNAGLVWR
jgi:hypothetical protein